MVEISLEAAIIAVAWFVSLFVAILIVPRLAGKKGVSVWTRWLMSKDAEPYMDKLADRMIVRIPKIPTTSDFMEAIEPRISGLEERINQPIQLDLLPLVAQVQEGVRVEVDKVRAVIDGKLGFATKVAKGVGEAAAEHVGTQIAAAAGVDPTQAQIFGELTNLLDDKEWIKAHPAAAIGLRILKSNLSGTAGGVTGGTYSPGLKRK